MSPKREAPKNMVTLVFPDGDGMSIDVPAGPGDAGFSFQIGGEPSVTLSEKEAWDLVALLLRGLRNGSK
jgi:hypothetical protein